jgi:hypothetical protein
VLSFDVFIKCLVNNTLDIIGGDGVHSQPIDFSEASFPAQSEASDETQRERDQSSRRAAATGTVSFHGTILNVNTVGVRSAHPTSS